MRSTVLTGEKRGTRSGCSGSRSLLSHSAFRPGITLTEVLISMGILTLGLLGVAALIPVGGFYQQKAEIADRASAIAQAAMNELVTSGMLDPRAWRLLATKPDASWPNFDGPSVSINTYQRPLAYSLENALAWSSTQATVQRQRNLARLFGHAFVIDPMAVAGACVPPSANQALNRAVGVFPASAYTAPAGINYSVGWTPWWWGSGSAFTWPVRRVSYPQTGSLTGVMTPSTAAYYFRGQDDLGFDFPNRDDRPAIQNWDITTVNGTPTPLARQWLGDYSWIATVVPTSNAARDAMARSPESHAYDVSVVVFHKRPVGLTAPQTNADGALASDALIQSEMYLRASIRSTGLNGGELLLEKVDSSNLDPFQQLRTGHWIMLCGPHPSSSDAEPRFVLNWYQVQSIESQGLGTTQRRVTVRGPQWPWQPRATHSNQNSNVAQLSDNLCAAIVRGAVAVHTKTIRLEGGTSAWAMR